jgi:transposase
MGRPKSTSAVDEALRKQAEQDYESLSNGIVAMRLQVIIALGNNLPIPTISQFCRKSRKTLFRWVSDYKEQGLAGLSDDPKGHRQRHLTPQQEEEIKRWVRGQINPAGQPIHWTLEQLSLTILERMKVEISIPRLSYWLNTWGFTPKVPRPRHKKANSQAQEEFKKKSDGSSGQADRGRSRTH